MSNIIANFIYHLRYPFYKVFSDLVGIFFNHINTYKVIKTLQENNPRHPELDSGSHPKIQKLDEMLKQVQHDKIHFQLQRL